MKSKVLATILMSSAIATGVYAYGGMNCNMNGSNCNMNGMNQGTYCNMQGQNMQRNNYNMMMNKNMMKKRGYNKGVLRTIYQLNLTPEQITKVRTFIQEHRLNRKYVNEAFTKDSFDKNKFVDIMSSKRENMIKSKALMLEKIYNILTPIQKEQFKTLIDLKTNRMKNKGIYFDQNSYGRR